MCFLIWEWLSQSDHASVDPDRRADDIIMETKKKKIVILVAARKCIFRWISELQRLQSMFSAVLWSSRFNASQHKFATSTLMVVPLESSFLLSFTEADIVDKIKLLIAHDHIAKRIAKNAENFGKSYLRLVDYYCYVATALDTIASLEVDSDVLHSYEPFLVKY